MLLKDYLSLDIKSEQGEVSSLFYHPYKFSQQHKCVHKFLSLCRSAKKALVWWRVRTIAGGLTSVRIEIEKTVAAFQKCVATIGLHFPQFETPLSWKGIKTFPFLTASRLLRRKIPQSGHLMTSKRFWMQSIPDQVIKVTIK